MSTLALVSALKDHSQDFEFYPTTDAMLNTIREDIQAILSAPFSHKYPIFSALDVGAGDGRALMRLTEGAGRAGAWRDAKLLRFAQIRRFSCE